jgi:hypothetical protein
VCAELAPYRFGAPRVPFIGLRVFASAPSARLTPGFIRSSTWLSFRVRQLDAALVVSDLGSSQGFLGPFSASVVSPRFVGVACPLRSVLELSQLLDGLRLTAPSGLVSSQRHSWGSRLQGFSLSESRTASPRPLPS